MTPEDLGAWYQWLAALTPDSAVVGAMLVVAAIIISVISEGRRPWLR